MAPDALFFGGIEGGGTKFNCAIGSSPENILAEARFATTTPEETLGQVIQFFAPRRAQLRGIGVGTFGPLDMDPSSTGYGSITATPKPHWSNVNIPAMLREKIGLPVAIDLDVVAAGLGEAKWGASRNDSPSLYLTIGTGIGGGYIINGKPLRGLVSPEMGHIRIPRDRDADPFGGSCPFHGDCFEGLASGPAIQARFHQRAEALSDDHPFWPIEAAYIAHALVNYILTLVPRRIIIGGGVMQKGFMLPAVRKNVRILLNAYIHHKSILEEMDQYIVPPALGSRSGVLGAIALIMESEQ